MKQRKSIWDGQAVFFDVHKQFLGPDHMIRQEAKTEKKLPNSHLDGEMK